MNEDPITLFMLSKRGLLLAIILIYSHPYFSDLTLKRCYEEIEKTDRIIEHIYQEAGVNRPAKFFVRITRGTLAGEMVRENSPAGRDRRYYTAN